MKFFQRRLAMLPTKYVALDVETGGIEKDTSLLTAYFGIYDADLNLIEDLYLRLKPDAPKGKRSKYVLTAEGMDVNGINIVDHEARAVTMKKGGQQLYQLLSKHGSGGNPLVPLGHNIYFDILGITERGLIGKGTWETFCSYRVVDTASIGRFLIEAGILPRMVYGSLGEYAKFFGISIQGQHDAERDVQITVGVYENFLKLLKNEGNA